MGLILSLHHLSVARLLSCVTKMVQLISLMIGKAAIPPTKKKYFVEGWGDDDSLQGRTVIVHCPTGTILEAIPTTDILGLNSDVLSLRFNYTGMTGLKEAYVMLLHTSPTFDKTADAGTIKELMKEAARWFTNYLQWEDKNITG